MSKATEGTLSKKNPFWIPKNRYYELKYFCYQYQDWQKQYASLDGLATRENREPTEREALEKVYLDGKIKLIQNTAALAGGWISDELLSGVTKGYSYDSMNTRKRMPCCREVYYTIYRKFFWLLDKERELIPAQITLKTVVE